MKLIIEIETENAAFSPSPENEIARILRDLQVVIVTNGLEQFGNYSQEEKGWPLRDFNGNRVGHIKYTES